MSEFINNNINLITTFGVFVAIIGVIITYYTLKKDTNNKEASSHLSLVRSNSESESKKVSQNNINIEINSRNNSNSNNIEITGDKQNESVIDNTTKREVLLNDLKKRIYILFIDDDKNFSIVNIFKQSGWKNTKSVVDIKTLETTQIREADIIFIDINGVGKLLECKNQGLDIAFMLKQKYPNKKVILYSADRKHDNFHEAWDLCDYKLEKNALPSEFINLIENYSIEIHERR